MSFLKKILTTLLALTLTFAPVHLKGQESIPLPPTWKGLVIFNPAPPGMGGCACPIGVGSWALTAKHVIADNPSLWFDPLSKDNPQGLRIAWTDPKLDIGAVSRDDDKLFPHPVQVAKHPPFSGDEVTIYGIFNHKSVVYHGHILTIDFDGLLGIDSMGDFGTSGGCVILDRTGELIGIASQLGIDFDKPMVRPAVWAVPVWGLKILK